MALPFLSSSGRVEDGRGGKLARDVGRIGEGEEGE